MRGPWETSGCVLSAVYTVVQQHKIRDHDDDVTTGINVSVYRRNRRLGD